MVSNDSALQALRRLTGQHDSEFRPGQRESISALVERKERVLVVQRTGWGKSAVYFIASQLLRQQGFGTTLIISPLLVLMDNQIAAAEKLGLRAVSINTKNNVTVEQLVSSLTNDEIDVLFISPERLANPQFANRVMPLLGRKPSLIVIDEVHCISDWGHDFRPDYRRIAQMIASLPSGIPILGTTATANDRVVKDVTDQLGTVSIQRGPLRRDSLALSVLHAPTRASRLAWIDKSLNQLTGTGIIYCLTIRDAEKISKFLQDRGHKVGTYHAEMEPDDREAAVRQLLGNRVKALVATVALGMGYDKPDIGFVIHYQLPGSVVTYYQQVGRAGRAIAHADAILMHGEEDIDILDYFTSSAFPPAETVSAILKVLDETKGAISAAELCGSLNLRESDIENVLKHLTVEGAVQRLAWREYQRTLAPYVYPAGRIAKLNQSRAAEKQQMLDYLATTDCRMTFLSNALDDTDHRPCGKCDNCSGNMLNADFAIQEIADAELLLRQGYESIIARKQRSNRASIPSSERCEDGRVLSRWRDGGFGDLVARGKQVDKRFSDELVAAVVGMIADWRPEPFPSWVTCVPASSSGNLVHDYAQRLAAALNLPFKPIVTKTRAIAKQKSMNNPLFQASNVANAFAVSMPVPKGAVFLVDDLVDSRWTMTEVGAVLRRAGSGPVFPVALSNTTGRG
jgi:ATP-dependent DNA helicase RecQ